MKKLFFLLCCLFLLGSMTAQNKVREQDKTMSLGSKYSYYVEIPGYTKKDAEKAWEEYTKPFGKTSYNKKAKEYNTLKAKTPIINGTKTTDLYATIEEGKNLATAYVWVDLGGAFATPREHSSQVEGIRTFMNDFWIFAQKKAVTKELENEEKKQKDFEKDLSKLENKNKDLHDEIAKLKEKIRQAEADIEQNLKDQDDKKVEIGTQKKVVEKTVVKLNNVGKEGSF